MCSLERIYKWVSQTFFCLWAQGPNSTSVINSEYLIYDMLYNRDGEETAKINLVFLVGQVYLGS